MSKQASRNRKLGRLVEEYSACIAKYGGPVEFDVKSRVGERLFATVIYEVGELRFVNAKNGWEVPYNTFLIEPEDAAPDDVLGLLKHIFESAASEHHITASDKGRVTTETTQMAKKKKSKKKASKRGGGEGKRPVGRTSGVGVQGTWVEVFASNRKAKLTDAQISAHMKSEFRGRESAVFDQVASVRRKYNLGGLTGGTVPKTQSVPYDEDGAVRPVRRGPTGSKKKTSKKKTGKKKSKKKASRK